MNKEEYIMKIKQIRLGDTFSLDIPEKFKNDYDVALEAVKHGYKFYELGEELRNKKEIILAALKYDTRILFWVPDDNLKKDKEFLMELVKHNASLAYAAPEIRDDEKFMLEAIRISGNAFNGASPRLVRDKEFIKKL